MQYVQSQFEALVKYTQAAIQKLVIDSHALFYTFIRAQAGHFWGVYRGIEIQLFYSVRSCPESWYGKVVHFQQIPNMARRVTYLIKMNC